MKKISIKGESLNFSILGLGTGTGFNKNSGKSQKDLLRAFDSAKDVGINWIDTAESYANGYAEGLIGQYLKTNKNSFYVASKFSPINASRNLLKKSCESSLKRLNVDCIDLYQIHWMNYNISINETLDVLMELKKDGKINAIGVCNFNLSELNACNNYEISTNQIEFNLFNRSAEEDLLNFHQNKLIHTIAYSPFEGIKLLKGSRKEKLLIDLQNKYSSSFYRIALSFLSSYKNMLVAYSSTNSEHINENSFLINLTFDEISKIKEIFHSNIYYIDPNDVKFKPYMYDSLDKALKNKLSYFPDVEMLSQEYSSKSYFKPIKVIKIKDKKFKYELEGGMMRYWGWIKAFTSNKPILALVIND
ncbi:aldo/keto reductase [Alphaproteobacteria bacterium]|nr:aldo/keto reductase [Alphaproteobacteria bacterium]